MRNGVWRRIGVHEDDRSATLQFFEDRLQYGIAQIHAGGVVNSATPSSPRTSNAYANSSSDASMSGSGR